MNDRIIDPFENEDEEDINFSISDAHSHRRGPRQGREGQDVFHIGDDVGDILPRTMRPGEQSGHDPFRASNFMSEYDDSHNDPVSLNSQYPSGQDHIPSSFRDLHKYNPRYRSHESEFGEVVTSEDELRNESGYGFATDHDEEGDYNLEGQVWDEDDEDMQDMLNVQDQRRREVEAGYHLKEGDHFNSLHIPEGSIYTESRSLIQSNHNFESAANASRPFKLVITLLVTVIAVVSIALFSDIDFNQFMTNTIPNESQLSYIHQSSTEGSSKNNANRVANAGVSAEENTVDENEANVNTVDENEANENTIDDNESENELNSQFANITDDEESNNSNQSDFTQSEPVNDSNESNLVDENLDEANYEPAAVANKYYDPENPYQYVSNPMPESVELSRVWTKQENENWHFKIQHEFPWQRYKTVEEVRTAKLAQSEAILWNALEDQKLWIRMRAIMGLAEFGTIITHDKIGQIIGNARKALISRFFKRFYRNTTEGELYILRESLEVVHPAARLAILKSLDKADPDNKWLYIAAASHDKHQKIKTWAKAKLNALDEQSRFDLLDEFEEMYSKGPPDELAESPTPPATTSDGEQIDEINGNANSLLEVDTVELFDEAFSNDSEADELLLEDNNKSETGVDDDFYHEIN